MIDAVTLNPSLDRTLAVLPSGGSIGRALIGAGDSLLSGSLHGGGRGPHALRAGVARATGAVQTPGTGVQPAELIDLDAAEVSAIE